MFISNFCCISPAGILQKGFPLKSLALPGQQADCLRAQEPDYSAWIPSIKLRRMPRLVKMGLAATKMCFGDSVPASIHIGSAFCMLQESEAFLKNLIDLKEEALPPTPFIQSTHNTVSGALALDAQVHGHNFTFSHRGYSFENALLDAELLGAEENRSNQYQLIGAVEEMTPIALQTMRSCGCIASEGIPAGEGVSIFKLTPQKTQDSFAFLAGLRTETVPLEETNRIPEKFSRFITAQKQKPGNTDYVVFGYDPNMERESAFKKIQENFFRGNPITDATPYCGVYPTASAFGLGVCLSALSEEQKSNYKRCWMVHNFGNYWSFWLLEKV